MTDSESNMFGFHVGLLQNNMAQRSNVEECDSETYKYNNTLTGLSSTPTDGPLPVTGTYRWPIWGARRGPLSSLRSVSESARDGDH